MTGVAVSSFRSSAAVGQLLMVGDGATGMGGRACMLTVNPDMLPATQAVAASAATL